MASSTLSVVAASGTTIFQIAGAALIGLLAVAFLGTLILSGIMLGLSRLSGDAAPRTRRLLSGMALAGSGDTVHKAQDAADEREISVRLAAIQARDPQFDQIAIVEAARRALFLVFVLQTTGDRQRLEQVTTEEFWQSPVGMMLAKQGDAQERIRDLRQRQFREPAGAGRRGASVSLDFHAGAATFRDVHPGDNGQDRVTMRLGYVGRGVITGSVADRQISAHHKKLWELALGGASGGGAGASLGGAGAAGAAGGAPSSGGLAQSEQRGYYDCEFVRPVGSRTEVGGAGRRCQNCGAPFASDLQSSCANCQATRVTPEGEWLLARSWLVVS